MKKTALVFLFILLRLTHTTAQTYYYSASSPENILGERSLTITLKIQNQRTFPATTAQINRFNAFNTNIVNGAGTVTVLYSYDSLALHLNDLTKVGAITKAFRMQNESTSPIPNLVDRRFTGNKQFIFPHTKFPRPDAAATYVSPTASAWANRMTNDEGRFYYKVVFKKGSTIVNKSEIKSFRLPKTLNVAVLGDSYASGEGAPQTGMHCTGLFPASGAAMWLNANCHRSNKSGLFQGVKTFAENNRNIAVVFEPFFVACTGARIANIGLIRKTGVLGIVEETQLKQLSNASKKHGQVDVLIINIGGNDIGFDDAVETAIMPGWSLQHYDNAFSIEFDTLDKKYDALNALLSSNCRYKKFFLNEYPNPTLGRRNGNLNYCGIPSKDWVNFLLQCLGEAYIEYTGLRNITGAARSLCDGIESIGRFMSGNNNSHNCDDLEIFDTEFYDYWENRNNERCEAGEIDKIIAALATAMSTLEVENCPATMLAESVVDKTLFALKGEIEFAHRNILDRLNDAGRRAVDRFNRVNNNNNWIYISGNEVASRGQGICNCTNSFFNGFVCSCRNQASYHGYMHMNEVGQSMVFRNNLSSNLQLNLSAADKRLYQSTNCPDVADDTAYSGNDAPDTVAVVELMKRDQEAFREFVNTRLPWLRNVPDDKNFLKFFKTKWANREFRAMRERTLRERR